MSSHREAPEISKDPVADSTDLYAFVSPDTPDMVTLIANYVPLAGTRGRTELLRVRRRRALRDQHRQRRRRPRRHHATSSASRTELQVGGTFLYNVGPDPVARQPELEPASVLLVSGSTGRRAAGSTAATAALARRALPCPPCNIGPLSTPDYAAPRGRGDPRPSRRRQGLRRPAGRGLLRRPRLGVRPRRPASVRSSCTRTSA